MGNSFFERYSALCKEDGETPNSIAKMIGASSGSVTAWKNGTAPRNATLSKIADHFKVSTDYLLGKSDNLAIVRLSDSQQEELRSIFAKALMQRGLTQAEAISQSGAGYNFFPRLERLSLHQVRENNLFILSRFLEVEDAVNLATGRTPDILEEVDVAFYGTYKKLTEEHKEALRAMAEVLKAQEAKKP